MPAHVPEPSGPLQAVRSNFVEEYAGGGALKEGSCHE